MSIVSEFYRTYAKMPYAQDYAEVVCAAVKYITDKVYDYWSQKEPSGGVDLSEMPGIELGFEPMDVQIFRHNLKKKEIKSASGEVCVFANTLLGDERQVIAFNEGSVSALAAMNRVVKASVGDDRYLDALSRCYLLAEKPKKHPIYSILPIDGYGANGLGSCLPVLCNLELGEVYYTSFSIAGRTNGLLKIKKQHAYPSVLAINWITGREYFIGCPVLEYKSPLSYFHDAWVIAEPDLKTTYRLHRERAYERKRETFFRVMRTGKGASSWDIYATPKRGRGERVIKADMSEEEIADILEEDPFALTEEEVEEAERTARAHVDATYPVDAEVWVKLGPPTTMEASVRSRLLAEHEETCKKLREAHPELVRKCRVEGTEPPSLSLPKISLPSALDLCGRIISTRFLERLYELPEGSLTGPVAEFCEKLNETTGRSCEQALFHVLHYMGNLFQSVLQTTQKNDWFLPMLMDSIRGGGKPLAEVDPDAKTLNRWLGINKPDYERLMAMDNEGPLTFMVLMNQIKPTSYKEFERCYGKVLELNRIWLAEFEYKAVHHTRELWRKKVRLKNKRGRVLFETLRLPQAMRFYTEHNLKSVCTPLQYFKYIIEEGKHSANPVTGECAPLSVLEERLASFNRMAKEISPRAKFVLPHHLFSAHDTMVDNYNRIVADKKLGEFSEYAQFASCYAGKIADVCPDEKFTMLAPTSSEDLYEEGVLLNHCVGSYGGDIVKGRGSMLIFFLRLRAKKQAPLVTVQVDKDADDVFQLTEVAGKGNRLPTEEEMDYCKRWLTAFNAAIAEAEREKRKMPVGYDAATTKWLTVTTGINIAGAPAYNAAQTKDENYVALFRYVLVAVREMLDADTLMLSKKDFVKKVYVECGRLKLKSETVSVIAKPFEDLLLKAA